MSSFPSLFCCNPKWPSALLMNWLFSICPGAFATQWAFLLVWTELWRRKSSSTVSHFFWNWITGNFFSLPKKSMEGKAVLPWRQRAIKAYYCKGLFCVSYYCVLGVSPSSLSGDCRYLIRAWREEIQQMEAPWTMTGLLAVLGIAEMAPKITLLLLWSFWKS